MSEGYNAKFTSPSFLTDVMSPKLWFGADFFRTFQRPSTARTVLHARCPRHWLRIRCRYSSFYCKVNTGWQKYSGTQIMLTSKWELRRVYQVSTCLSLRCKYHLQVNKICVPEYFFHPVQGGPSGCAPRFVDSKLRAAFYFKEATLWQYFCFDVNKR